MKLRFLTRQRQVRYDWVSHWPGYRCITCDTVKEAVCVRVRESQVRDNITKTLFLVVLRLLRHAERAQFDGWEMDLAAKVLDISETLLIKLSEFQWRYY